MRGGLALLATIGAALSVATLPAAALAASPPEVQIEPAEQTPTGFKLKAKVNPEGSATSYYFIYKRAGEIECEDLEGCGPETPHGGPLTGDTQQEVQAEVTGLTAGTNYSYWLIARNANPEAVRSRELTFTTPPASAPAIEWTNAWNLTPTDATVGAGINPDGLSRFGAYYEFQVVANTSEYLSEIACPPRAKLRGTDGCGPGPEVEDALPIGQVPDATKGETVTLDLANAGMTLKPGTTYHYRVLAAKALETEDTLQWEPPAIVGPDQTFTTPLASTPSIESESASSVTPTAATLEATVNSEDLPQGAYYQFQLVKSTSEYLPELACPEPSLQLNSDDGCNSPDIRLQSTAGALPIGFIAKGPEGQSVSQSLTAAGVTLAPGTTYHYRVLAAKRVQSEDGINWQGPAVAGADHTFTTPPPPAIASTSVSNVTERDATLQAQINTEGVSMSYQFLLSAICGGKGACLVVVNYPLPSGLLLGSFLDQSVSLDLNAAGVTLQPGGTYTYSVSATSSSGTTESAPHNFTTPENVVEPLSTASPLSGAGQPAGSYTSSGGRPAGSGGSSSASTPGVVSPDIPGAKTTKLKSLTNAQKLAKALKVCAKEPKRQRASCKKQAHKRYVTSGKQASTRKK